MIPVAQYMRMSSEHQKYSIANQTAAISEFAVGHGFKIIETYADLAKSGVYLKGRIGLQNLLRDVTGKDVRYKAVLVYDVSRWGRFEDDDEAACYEFLCRRFGVKVIYCEETFPNDGSVVSSILKTLSRIDAREFSKELSLKIFESKLQLAKLGFWPGGPAPYGFARKLISEEDPTRNRILNHHDRKALPRDKVILVPASTEEITTVRTIYRLALKHNTYREIETYLNQKGFHNRGARWNKSAIGEILKNPLYSGCNVWGKTCRRIGYKPGNVKATEWVITPKSFTPIVTPKCYRRVQDILHKRRYNSTWTDEELLSALYKLRNRAGTLSATLINRTFNMPATNTIAKHFGSLSVAYKRIGYDLSESQAKGAETKCKLNTIKRGIINQIVSLHPNQIAVSGLSTRPQLHIKNGHTLTLLIPPVKRNGDGIMRWVIVPVELEFNNPVLICRRNLDDDQIEIFLFPKIGFEHRRTVADNDPWWSSALKLGDFSELLRASYRFAA